MTALDTSHVLTELQVCTSEKEKTQICSVEAEGSLSMKKKTKASCEVYRNSHHDLKWYFCHLEEDSSVEPDALLFITLQDN